jgi:hypothetical protein
MPSLRFSVYAANYTTISISLIKPTRKTGRLNLTCGMTETNAAKHRFVLRRASVERSETGVRRRNGISETDGETNGARDQ